MWLIPVCVSHPCHVIRKDGMHGICACAFASGTGIGTIVGSAIFNVLVLDSGKNCKGLDEWSG